MSVKYSVLRTADALEGLVPEWATLWDRAPDAKPFQRPEWLVPWWRHFRQPELHVGTAREGGALVGLLPLYVYREPVSGERKLLLLGAGTTDYLDGVFAARCPDDVALELVRRTAADAAFDRAYLFQLRASSPLTAALRTLAEPGAAEATSFCAASTIRDLPKKVRADVLYHRNAAIARGRLGMRVSTAETCREDLEILIRLHTANWQERGKAGVLADPAVLAWHREMVPLLQMAGLLRLTVLELEGEPIAALYALADPAGAETMRTQYFYLVGHSPAHAALKPGTLLTAMAVEQAASEGFETVDMLRGEESYKKFWRVTETPTFGFSLSRESLVGA